MALIRDLFVAAALIVLFGFSATCTAIGFGWLPEAIAASEKRMSLEIMALGIAAVSIAIMFGLGALELRFSKPLVRALLTLTVGFLIGGAILLMKSAAT